jgi:hypothetical protein
VRIHAQQFELTADESGGLFGIRSGSGAATVHVGGEVMNLFAILFRDFGAA